MTQILQLFLRTKDLEKMLSKILMILVLSFSLAACSSEPTTYSENDQSEFKKSARKAIESISAGGNVKVSVSEGSAHSAKTDGFHTGFFNMAAAYQTARLPLNIVVELDNSPPARRVKSEGANVYVYAKPQLILRHSQQSQGFWMNPKELHADV